MSHDIYKRLMVSELDRDYDNILFVFSYQK